MNVRIAREARDVQQRQVDVTREDKQLAANQAQADSLTDRFQTLMDGYEIRIKDLTEEVKTLRNENRSLTTEVRALHTEMAKLRRSIDNGNS